jgi:hypothetical protein
VRVSLEYVTLQAESLHVENNAAAIESWKQAIEIAPSADAHTSEYLA